ncbi:Protein COFACTOR ASSEMBLY OF COMPLEX C SUBUNIT B CCB2, chloroplastic [Linum grandiflorum]
MSSLSIGSLTQLNCNNFRLPSNRTRRFATAIRAENSQPSKDQQDQLNVSVLRFTFGIPGLDETYLPRWIGYGFGSLLLLNHFLGSDSTATTAAQLRTEALGLSLAAFSVSLPYLGRFLKGATRMEQATLPEGAQQIFVMSPTICDAEKEEFAWGTYILLRNTNSIAVLISMRGELCVRGYWNVPYSDAAKDSVFDWFQRRVENIGLADLKDTLYLQQVPESGLREMLPDGTRSLLIVPVLPPSDQCSNEMMNNIGFVLLASNLEYAYSEKDRAWIKAIANKFRGESICSKVQTLTNL